MAEDNDQRASDAKSPEMIHHKKGALFHMLEGMGAFFKAAVPPGMERVFTPARITRLVMAAASQPGSSLFDCNPQSVGRCVGQAVGLGLDPGGGTGECYLVPFRSRGQLHCQLIIGYRGVVTLARRNGKLLSLEAHAVYENDQLDVRLGTESHILHRPKLLGDRGEFVSVYCVAHLEGGGPPQHDWMSIEHVKQSVGYIKAEKGHRPEESPWRKHFAEMAKKTVILRASKLLPISPDLAEAMALEAEDHSEAGSTDEPQEAQRPNGGMVGHIQAQADKLRKLPSKSD